MNFNFTSLSGKNKEFIKFKNNNKYNDFIIKNTKNLIENSKKLELQPYKIGLLIPTSNKGKNWKNAEDTYLWNILINSFKNTVDDFHNYVFYIGIDEDDQIWSKNNNINKILELKNNIKNVDFKFYKMNKIPKGHVTEMWNKLFNIAYNDNCSYFFQCGDDIELFSNFFSTAIKVLLSRKNIGVTGPISKENSRVITQTFVSRSHMHIFGYYFPKNIKNWYCDDWINEVYKPNFYYPLITFVCANKGGKPRYDNESIELINQKKITYNQIEISKKIFLRYLTFIKVNSQKT